jgi:hypothetical protein
VETAAVEPDETVETATEEQSNGSTDVSEAPAPVAEATQATAVEDAAEDATVDESAAEEAASEEAAAPVEDEPVADEPVAYQQVAGEPVADVPAEDEPAAEAAVVDESAAEGEPVSALTVAEPVASAAPQPPRGIWTEEQAEALRTRVREATTRVVDRAAGAVIETVNNLASAIRARTSDRRGDGTRR